MDWRLHSQIKTRDSIYLHCFDVICSSCGNTSVTSRSTRPWIVISTPSLTTVELVSGIYNSWTRAIIMWPHHQQSDSLTSAVIPFRMQKMGTLLGVWRQQPLNQRHVTPVIRSQNVSVMILVQAPATTPHKSALDVVVISVGWWVLPSMWTS